MKEARLGSDRGYADHGWLKSFHTFSFADYHDPDHMGFGSLRVINEDRIAGGSGFGTHPHRDMEIITYVLDGELAHRDSTGISSVIRAGDVQRMSAGHGVFHSEYNHSQTHPVHLLQIWILPNVRGIAPEYEQKYFPAEDKRGRLRLIASSDGSNGSVQIHQDARVYAGLFDGEENAALSVPADRQLYVHLATGRLEVNGERLEAGDALKLTDIEELRLTNGKNAEVLVFELTA